MARSCRATRFVTWDSRMAHDYPRFPVQRFQVVVNDRVIAWSTSQALRTLIVAELEIAHPDIHDPLEKPHCLGCKDDGRVPDHRKALPGVRQCMKNSWKGTVGVTAEKMPGA